MEGFLASIVLIAVLVGVLLVAGGLVYLLALRAHRQSKRSIQLVAVPPGPSPRGYRYSPASPEGHAVGLAGMAAAVYLAVAGQVLACVAVVGAVVIIVFVNGTPPGGA
jgi:hypothetical protein